MDYTNKYIKYKNRYLGTKNCDKKQETINNYVIIGHTRGKSFEYIPELKKELKSLNGKVYEYKYMFTKSQFTLEDLTFESVSENIKLFVNKKKISDIIIICLEESSPFGLFFADKNPDLCKAIICYPLRLNTKESLDRLYHKFVEKKGWKHISKSYSPIDYFFEINNERLKKLFKKNRDEEKNIIDLIINLQMRKQYNKIPKIYNIPTYLFSRLDMDSVSLIKLNFERKEIAEMKGILSPDDAIYSSMMWNIARIQYDRELMELNKNNNNLRIHYMIAFEKNEDIRLIMDAIKILII